MPEWTYYYTIFSPVIFILVFIALRRIPIFITIIMGLLTLIVNALYFESLDMKPVYAFLPILTTVLKYIGEVGNVLSLGVSIAFLVIWIKAIINLGDRFSKGEGFKIGLFFLPFIFFPILGFEKD